MNGFRIGRIFGIEVRVAWSWLFIFVLLTWNLFAVFTQWHPDWPGGEAFIVAAGASLVFFACILLHELAHSVVAKGFGVRVRSITLFLFGGVSNIEREPPSPKVEFLMAVAGPITSLALGVAALLLASALTPLSVNSTQAAWGSAARLGPLGTLLVWLGPINIVIGLFNLIPGFPLDGGRILRSILWSLTGQLRQATRWAAATGQTIAWLLIAAGLAMSFGVYIPLLGTGFINGLWLAFIGWFMHGAASMATTRLALDDAFAGITVEQLMQRDCPVAPPELSVSELVHRHLIPGDDRALPVVRDGVFLGLVSVADVRRVPAEEWSATTVESIMRPRDQLSVVGPDEPLAKAFERLARQDIEQLPVVAENTRLVGMLRRRDIARWLELAWKPGPEDPARTGSSRGKVTPAWPGHAARRRHAG